MLKKAHDKLKYLYYTVGFWLLNVQYALAGQNDSGGTGSSTDNAAAGINPITPDTLITKVRELFMTIGIPFGMAVMIGCAIYVAVRIMAAGGDSRKRQEAIEGLQAVIIGGLILGGIPFFVGVILGLGQWFSGAPAGGK